MLCLRVPWVYSNYFPKKSLLNLSNDEVVSSGLAYKYNIQCTCVEDYNVYNNKIFILNVRIDPESAYSKLLVVFVWCVFTMNRSLVLLEISNTKNLYTHSQYIYSCSYNILLNIINPHVYGIRIISNKYGDYLCAYNIFHLHTLTNP